MSVPQPLDFLSAVAGFQRADSRSSADRPVRLATVDPAYVAFTNYPDAPPPARVTFDGETTLSTKAYGYVAGMVPWPGIRVYLVPVGNTYVIGGAINPQTPQGFWSNAAGTDSGVEFGGGSHFDTDEGLVIAHDAAISGDLSVGGVGAYLFKQQGNDGPSIANTATTWGSPSTLFLDLPVGTWVVDLSIAYTTVGGDIQTRWAFNGAWTGGKFIQGPSPFNAATVVVNDANSRDSAPQRSGWHGFTTAIPYGGNDAANYAAIHEWGVAVVTTTGRWTLEYTQRVSNGSQAMVRGPSFMTARRVA